MIAEGNPQSSSFAPAADAFRDPGWQSAEIDRIAGVETNG
jgi:hypothetical protein